MGHLRARSQPLTLIVDGPPQLTSDAAAALLRLVQHLVELQSQSDGPADETAVAS